MNVLVLAAHADDEALGCGATIARHIAEGDAVRIVFLTNGVGARHSSSAAQSTDAQARQAAAERALAALGARCNRSFDFPDNALDSVPRLELARAVESIAVEFPPSVVYTHHPGDLNIDHRRAFDAVMTAFRPQPGGAVSAIYCFEVASSTGWSGSSAVPPFCPQHYVDVTRFLHRKMEALRAYSAEMRPWPHARSLEAVQALAAYRGAQVAVAAAEAFTVERHIRFDTAGGVVH